MRGTAATAQDYLNAYMQVPSPRRLKPDDQSINPPCPPPKCPAYRCLKKSVGQPQASLRHLLQTFCPIIRAIADKASRRIPNLVCGCLTHFCVSVRRDLELLIAASQTWQAVGGFVSCLGLLWRMDVGRI